MKIFLSFLILMVSLILIGLGITAPMAKNLTVCIDNQLERMEADMSIAAEEKWNKEDLCFKQKQNLELLVLCYDEVEKKSFLSIELIERIAKVIRHGVEGLEDWISVHNEECSNFPGALFDTR